MSKNSWLSLLLFKKGVFSLLAKICFCIGAALLCLAEWYKTDFFWGNGPKTVSFWIICWTFLCVLAPLFGIVGNITSPISCWKKKWPRVIFLILFEVGVLLIFGLRIVPYIYAAPVLSNSRLRVYREMIGFVKEHNDFNEVDLDEFGRVGIDSTFCILGGQNSGQSELLRIVKSDEVQKLLKISRDFHKIGCFQAFRKFDFVFFRNRYFMNKPGRCGIVYSINGRDPNDIDEITFKGYRPFIRITDNWYMSRSLILRPHLLISLPPMPNGSLIDHSLRVENIDIGSDIVSFKTGRI
jgi:hypothetical protein